MEMSLPDLIGKEVASIETKESKVTYCYHINSPEYKNGITKKEYTQPISICVKFTDGTEFDIDIEELGCAYLEEGSIRLATSLWKPE